MTDLCQQCSIEALGSDSACFADPSMADNLMRNVVCEGCGDTYVNNEGMCMGGCSNPLHSPALCQDCD
jgi:hypothetical protein